MRAREASGGLHRLFEWFGSGGRAGAFLFFTLVSSMAYAVGYFFLFGVRGDEGTPVPFTPLLLAGLVAIVASFVSAGRSRAGRWPTMPMVAFAYLFAITIVRILLGVADHSPLAPDVPDVLVYATRAGIYWMVFAVGWILAYGTPRGWNRREVDPWPFRWLFRKAPPVADGKPDEEEEGA